MSPALPAALRPPCAGARFLRRIAPCSLALLFWSSGSPRPVQGQPMDLVLDQPALDRWMYPHNATPGLRPTAPVFGTLGDESGVDSRHGQFLVGFDLASLIQTNLGPGRYLVTRCRLSVTVSRDRSFLLDPTTDPPASYLPAGHPEGQPDPDPGRPVELFGVDYRNGFAAESFLEDSPFGNAAMGRRNAFAAGFDANGTLVDVGNSVGKTNVLFPVFAARPFAVGHASDVTPGEPVPAGTTLGFDLDLSDPLVAGYLQEACHTGRLRLMLTSLQTSGFGGQPAWSEFHTRESVLGDPPALRLSGTVIRADDEDTDGLPDDWERHHFGSLTKSGAGDADGDGASDRAEWEAGTDPASKQSLLFLELGTALSGPGPRLRFRHAPGRRYELFASDDLLGWVKVESVVPNHEVGSGWAGFDLPDGLSSSARFFRVVALGVAGLAP